MLTEPKFDTENKGEEESGTAAVLKHVPAHVSGYSVLHVFGLLSVDETSLLVSLCVCALIQCSE